MFVTHHVTVCTAPSDHSSCEPGEMMVGDTTRETRVAARALERPRKQIAATATRNRKAVMTRAQDERVATGGQMKAGRRKIPAWASCNHLAPSGK